MLGMLIHAKAAMIATYTVYLTGGNFCNNFSTAKKARQKYAQPK